jgi:PAS domain S-box-containing protein
MRRFFTRAWQRQGLYLRVALSCAAATCFAFSVQVYLEISSIHQKETEAKSRELDTQLSALSQMLTEANAIGGEEVVRLALPGLVQNAALEWVDLKAGDSRTRAVAEKQRRWTAPRWFVNTAGLEAIERQFNSTLPDGTLVHIVAREDLAPRANAVWTSATTEFKYALTSSIVVLCAALLMLATTLRPLARLTEAVAQFGSGEHSVRIPVSGSREIANCIRAFNRMADQIQSGLAALCESEAKNRRLAMIAEQTNEAILTRDMSGKITFWNRGAEKLFGYSAAEAIGRTARELHMRNLSDDEFEALRSQVQARQHWANEGERITKSGKLIYVAAKAAPMYDEHGTMIGAIGIAQDISERREMELALRRAHDELEERVLERTEQLAAATVAAEQASRAKSDFLANMSHEVRTPMNGVLGMLTLLLKSELQPRQRHFAQTAHNSGVALLKVLNDILDFSKIEAGKLELESVSFSVRATVTDLVQLFAQRAFDKGVEIACRIEPEVPEVVCGDPGRIRQVLANLIGNAVKFTNAGEIVVRVDVAARDNETALLRFSVRDTGVGIDAAAQARIFEPFEQAEAGTTRRFGGTGLGLAVSKSLVELLGGNIGVDSTPGQGSIFWFTARLNLAAAELPAAQSNAPQHDLRILAAEPNATLREILRHQLQEYGEHTDVVASSAELFSRLTRAAEQQQPHHVAVLAIASEDDLQWVNAIRSRAALDSVRLVLLSSLAVDVPAARQRELRIDRVLNKPVSEHQLRTALRQNAPGEAEATPAVVQPRYDAHILVVDDYGVNQEIARDLLEELSCRVDVASNGREGVDAVARQRYDLVLMDCQMPLMDGFQATAEIRQREAAGGSRLPIIALTANAMRGDRDLCIAAGMDDYLSKPFEPAQLYAVLARWLKPVAAQQEESRLNPVSTNPPPPAAPVATPAAVTEATPVIDPKAIAKLRAIQRPGRPSSLHKWVGAFLSSAHEHMQTMREAADRADALLLQRAAHTLKSGAAQFGAYPFSQRCAVLEALAKDGSVAGAAPLIDALRAEFEPVRAALEAELQNCSATTS